MADETNSIPAVQAASTARSIRCACKLHSRRNRRTQRWIDHCAAPAVRPAAASVPGPKVARALRRGRRSLVRSAPGGRKFFRRKKVCKFTVEKIDHISYRDVRLLQGFISDRGKIIPRRLTGTSAPFQRKLTKAIKQARAIALLPYAARF